MRPPGATNPGRSPELPALAIPAPPPASVDPSVPGGPGAPATAARPAPDAPPPLGGVPALPGAGQVAVVPPPDPGPGRGVAALGGSEYRLVFDGAASDLRPTDREVLTGLAARLAREQSARLRVSAYAGGATGEEREARRLSLSRALAVREYLIGQGIRATRIDVRALGAAAQGGPSDRVDLVVVN
jgi:outer membrane protein OmpA-like peptidoglycan-associated protein